MRIGPTVLEFINKHGDTRGCRLTIHTQCGKSPLVLCEAIERKGMHIQLAHELLRKQIEAYEFAPLAFDEACSTVQSNFIFRCIEKLRPQSILYKIEDKIKRDMKRNYMFVEHIPAGSGDEVSYLHEVVGSRQPVWQSTTWANIEKRTGYRRSD